MAFEGKNFEKQSLRKNNPVQVLCGKEFSLRVDEMEWV